MPNLVICEGMRSTECPFLFCVVLLSFFMQGGELDPEDDPNNQGEDEFEEAEDERPDHRVAQEDGEVVVEEEEEEEEEEEPVVPAKHKDKRSGPKQPAVEEELVVSRGRNEVTEVLTGRRLKVGRETC